MIMNRERKTKQFMLSNQCCLVKQVRTPPVRPADGVVGCVYESSVPGDNLDRGSRRNQLRRGHGSPPVLSEVPYELSTDAHSKECKRSPQQFIPAGFPPHDNLQPGTGDSASPLTTPDLVRSGRVPHTSVKSPIKIQPSPRLNCYSLSSY